MMERLCIRSGATDVVESKTHPSHGPLFVDPSRSSKEASWWPPPCMARIFWCRSLGPCWCLSHERLICQVLLSPSSFGCGAHPQTLLWRHNLGQYRLQCNQKVLYPGPFQRWLLIHKTLFYLGWILLVSTSSMFFVFLDQGGPRLWLSWPKAFWETIRSWGHATPSTLRGVALGKGWLGFVQYIGIQEALSSKIINPPQQNN